MHLGVIQNFTTSFFQAFHGIINEIMPDINILYNAVANSIKRGNCKISRTLHPNTPKSIIRKSKSHAFMDQIKPNSSNTLIKQKTHIKYTDRNASLTMKLSNKSNINRTSEMWFIYSKPECRFSSSL